MAYDRVDPFGHDRLDVGFAIVACTLATIWSDKKRKKPKIGDFIPDFGKGRRRRRQSEQEMFAIMQTFMDAHNANIEKKKGQ